MPEYTENELLDLEVEYRNNHTVLRLIQTVKEWQMAFDIDSEDEDWDD